MEEQAAAAADAAEVAAAPPAPVGPVGVTPPLLSPAVVALLVATVSSLGSFYLLLPVVPLYAAAPYRAGDGAAGLAAGLATGAMMLSTVLTELAMPGLLRRFGYRTAFVLGLLLLGAPAAVLPVSPSLGVVLGVCLARGAGLGIVVVTGTAQLADQVPPERHGEGLGIYGRRLPGLLRADRRHPVRRARRRVARPRHPTLARVALLVGSPPQSQRSFTHSMRTHRGCSR
jgi:hypothetical protein